MAINVHIVRLQILYLLLLLSCFSFPQGEQVQFEHITIEDGLPENSAKCILQDHLGFLWLGTQNGLVKYDGYSMTIYQPEPDDPNSISNRQINALCEDKTGTLWVGTGWYEGGGLNRFDRTTETFTRYLHNPDDSSSLNSNYVLSICEDKSGRLWVGTDKGLNLFNPVTSSFAHYDIHDWIYNREVYNYLSTLKNNNKSLGEILKVGNNANITKTFFIERETPVLIAVMAESNIDYGWIEDEKREATIRYDFTQSHYAGGRNDNRIQIILDTLKAGRYKLRYISDYIHSYGYWIGEGPDFPEHWGIQVFDVDEDTQSISQLLVNHNYIPINTEILAIIENPSSRNLYLRPSFPGLWMFDVKDKIFKRLDRQINEVLNFNQCWINSFHLAKDGKIWISNDCGLAQLDPKSEELSLYQVIHTSD